jgi:Protein of unknown function (DUF1329)
MRQRLVTMLLTVSTIAIALAVPLARAQVKPGDTITSADIARIKDLVAPGVLRQVQIGLTMKIVAPEHIDWPPPYKSATEQYSKQVSIGPDHKTIVNYVAGCPFPKIDANDPDAAVKAIWNSEFRPGTTDDYDLRFAECYFSKGGEQIEQIEFGHYAGYNLVGRTEIQPIPTDPDFKESNRLWVFGLYPALEPAELRGGALIRYRYGEPSKSDASWAWNPGTRRTRELSEDMLANPTGIGGWTPDHYGGFNAKIEEYSYKLLGQKPMLAVMHASHLPPTDCPANNAGCAENWEMRNLYIIEADPKTAPTNVKTIVYLDSETWFTPYLETYMPSGEMQESSVYYIGYGDRSMPQANVAVYPFKRLFITTARSFDSREGVLTRCYLPGPDTEDTEGWYINLGTVDREFFTTRAAERAAP